MVPRILLSPSNELAFNHPNPSQLALDTRPYLPGDFISPKSTLPTSLPPSSPAESLGRARSLSLQRNHLRLWPPTCQLSPPQPFKPLLPNQHMLDHSNSPPTKPPFADYAITSTCHSYLSSVPTHPDQHLDWLAHSFSNSSTFDDHTAWEPVQSFKKLVNKRPRFSTGRSSIHFSSLSHSSSATSSASSSSLSLDPPSKRLARCISDQDILAELQAPSHSIEEENLKVELLRVKRAELAASHSPLLTTQTDSLVSSKRKASNTIANTEAAPSQTKIARHSPFNLLAYQPKPNVPVPSMAELGAIEPDNSRLI